MTLLDSSERYHHNILPDYCIEYLASINTMPENWASLLLAVDRKVELKMHRK